MKKALVWKQQHASTSELKWKEVHAEFTQQAKTHLVACTWLCIVIIQYKMDKLSGLLKVPTNNYFIVT